MANTLITPSVIAKEALMQLRNNMVMGANVHREYKNEFVKVGATVSIRKPVKFVAEDGATRVPQNVDEATIPFVINKRKHVSWAFSTQDLTLTIEKYSERYIQPAAIALANIVDSDLCELYKDIWEASGAAGTTPATWKAFAAAATELNRFAVPMDRRRLVFDPDAQLNAADVLRALNQPELVKGAVRGMKVGMIGEMETYMDQNIKTHTAGTNSGDTAYLIDGAGQTGSTLTIDTGAGTFVVGDIITIASVNSVNPVSRVSTGNVKKFTVTANMSGGGTSVSISPAIVTSGAHKNVDTGPADNAAITITAAHQANLAFHRNAFGLVMVPLEMPDGAAFKSRQTSDDISIRVVKDYDIDEDEDIIRLDILYGVKSIYPDLGCRLLG
jgi:hypothetical protein